MAFDFNPNVGPGFNNPISGVMGGTTGNPANYAFAPPMGISTGMGMMADGALGALIKHLTGGAPITRTMGRPGISDYAYTSATERYRVANSYRPRVNASDPFLRSLGAYGENAMVQQGLAMTGWSPSGSMSENFNVLMGRFGPGMAGGGRDKIGAQGLMAETMLRNMMGAFTDKRGVYDRRGKAYGLSFEEVAKGAAAWSDTFGRSAGITALGTPGASASAIEQGQKEMGQMAAVTRELGNLFGPDKGMDELMKSFEGMTSGMKDLSPSKAKEILQKVQATAVVVNMSNESIVKYFDMMKNLYSGLGIKGNTMQMAQQALVAGKAIVDDRKAKAAAEGRAYTGPDAVELSQKVAEGQAATENSEFSFMANAVAQVLSDEGPEGELKRKMNDAYKRRDTKAFNEMRNQIKDPEKLRQIDERFQGMVERGGLTALERELSEEQGLGMATPEQAATAAGATIADFLLDKTSGSYGATMDIVGAEGVQRFSEAWKSGQFSRETMASKKKGIEQIMKVDPSLSRSQAEKIWGNWSSTLSQGGDTNVEKALDMTMNQSERNAAGEGTASVAKVQQDIDAVLGEQAGVMHGIGAGDIVGGLVSAYNDITDDGKRKEMSFRDILANAGDVGKKLLGIDPKSKQYTDAESAFNWAVGRDSPLKKQMDDAVAQAKTAAASEREGWAKSGKYTEEQMNEKQASREAEIATEKQREILRGAGVSLPDEAAAEGGSDFSEVIKAIEDAAKAIAGAVAPPKDGSQSNPENPSQPAPQNGTH